MKYDLKGVLECIVFSILQLFRETDNVDEREDRDHTLIEETLMDCKELPKLQQII